jgi:hypothetical protein
MGNVILLLLSFLIAESYAAQTATVITATTLPLPTGAATSAKQDAGNTSLASILSALGSPMQEHTTAGSPLSCKLVNTAGSFYDAGGAGGGNAAASATGSAVPASASYTGYNSGGSLVGVSTANALPVAQQGSIAVTGTFWQSTQPVSIASMPSTPVTGTFWQTTQPVSGTFWQSTQPVSGPLTDTQLRATPVPVSGTIAATQSGTFTVQPGNTANTTAWKVDGSAVTQPVSGTVSANATLAAETTKVIGTVNVAAAQTIGISAIVPGTGTTNLGKLEDVTALSGDTGVAFLAVRKDNSGQTTNADGDYVSPAADAYGDLFVRNDHPNRIRCTVTVSTATTLTAVGSPCSAPGAALSIYVTDIMFDASAAGIAADAFPTLKYGTGGTCGTGTTVFWGALSAAAVSKNEHFSTPIRIPLNNEICWISSTAGSKFITILGYIAP